MKITALLLPCLLAVAAAQAPDTKPAETKPVTAEDTKIGFTWWNDFAERVTRGNAALAEKNFELSEQYYRDAQLTDPEKAEAAFNLGLARAKQDDFEGAADQFLRSLDLMGEDAQRRAQANYNLGLSQYRNAEALDKAKKREAAVEEAIKALDTLNGIKEPTPEMKNDVDLATKRTRELIAKMTQQQQQQQQQGDDQQEGDNQSENQDSSQDNQQNGDQSDRQKPGDQNSEQKQDQEPKSGEEQEEKRDQQEQQQQANAGQEEKSKPLTPKEARELLNLIDDSKTIPMSASRASSRKQPEKDW